MDLRLSFMPLQLQQQQQNDIERINRNNNTNVTNKAPAAPRSADAIQKDIQQIQAKLAKDQASKDKIETSLKNLKPDYRKGKILGDMQYVSSQATLKISLASVNNAIAEDQKKLAALNKELSAAPPSQQPKVPSDDTSTRTTDDVRKIINQLGNGTFKTFEQ